MQVHEKLHARVLDAPSGTKLFPRYKKVFTTNTLICERFVHHETE